MVGRTSEPFQRAVVVAGLQHSAIHACESQRRGDESPPDTSWLTRKRAFRHTVGARARAWPFECVLVIMPLQLSAQHAQAWCDSRDLLASLHCAMARVKENNPLGSLHCSTRLRAVLPADHLCVDHAVLRLPPTGVDCTSRRAWLGTWCSTTLCSHARGTQAGVQANDSCTLIAAKNDSSGCVFWWWCHHQQWGSAPV